MGERYTAGSVAAGRQARPQASMTRSLLRRAIQADFLSCSALAALFGVTDRTAQRWLAGERTPEGGYEALLKAALRLMDPPERAQVLMWIAEETGGGCAVIDLETYRLLRELQALGHRNAA
jgi:transposase